MKFLQQSSPGNGNSDNKSSSSWLPLTAGYRKQFRILGGFAILVLLILMLLGGCGCEQEFLSDTSWVGTYQQQETLPSGRKRLRIAQVATLEQSVPPPKYGSIERIVYFLTEEFVRRGHDVTLFASSDSNTSAKLLISNSPAMRTDPSHNKAAYQWQFDQVQARVDDFDILHFHSEMLMRMQPVFRVSNTTAKMITMHYSLSGRHDLEGAFKDFPIVSISQDQRLHAAGHHNFIATIYHGEPASLFTFVPKPPAAGKPYLAFLGRLDSSKGPEMAIRIAAKAGIPLKMAFKLDSNRQNYWKNTIKPMMDEHKDLVEYVGELDDRERDTFLGNALALLFPIDWDEPFGMVMIESMACGTPVVARRRGAVPEVVEEGVSGLIFDSLEEGVQAVKRVADIDRAGVRRAFERRFTVDKMVDGYEQLYYQRLGMTIN